MSQLFVVRIRPGAIGWLAMLMLACLLLSVTAVRAASLIRVTPTGTTTWPCGDTWAAACALQTNRTDQRRQWRRNLGGRWHL